MSVHFDQPAWLWLLLAAIPTALVGWRMFASMSPARRAAAILARVVLIAVIAALLAGLSTRRETTKLAVVALVDVSGSVQRFYEPPGNIPSPPDAPPPADAASAVRAFLSQAAGTLGEEDLLGVVAFDQTAYAVALPTRSEAWRREVLPTSSEGTNLAEAIRLASAMIPPDAAGRLVLFSDGNQTTGDALAAAAEVTGRATRGVRGGLPLDVVPLSYSLRSEVLVESVDAPPVAQAQATVNVRVVLWSTAESTGTLRLLREGQQLDIAPPDAGQRMGRRIALSPGRNVEVVEVRLPPGRVHRFEAVYEPDVRSDDNGAGALAGDRLVENNRAQAFTITPGRGTVLLLDGVREPQAQDDAGVLAQTLRRAGIDVTIAQPESGPANILALQAFDLVILENVAADRIDPARREQLVSFVRDLGGGLVMVGGPSSLGAGAWRGTEVEPILPVLLDLPDRIVAPEAATVFVLDNSGSMRRPVLGSIRDQQAIANDAAALAIASLDRNDLVSVVVFNSDASVVVPLRRNDSQDIIDRVRSISSGGGTDIADGLEAAIAQLSGAKAKVLHVVLLSDGKSMREQELPGLAQRLSDMGAKLSTIAVGDDADLRMMARLADIGGGTFYDVNDPNVLPQIFLKAVRVVRSPLVREGDFVPVLLPAGSPLAAGLSSPPPLGGLVLTRPRPDPTVSVPMVTPTGEPVLAHWSVGLGQVVVFTSDAHQWASRWIPWDGYERMWTQVVRGASRAPGGTRMQAGVITSGSSLTLRLEARADDGSPLSGLTVPATVFTPSGQQREVALTAVAPGIYEGATPADQTGSYVALFKPSGASGQRLDPVVTGSTIQEGAEFRELSSNDALLESLARAGGGRILDIARPENAQLFRREGIEPARAVTPWARWLLIASLVLLWVDIAGRRVAWDRFVSARFRGEVGKRLLDAERSARVGAERTVSGLRTRLDQSDEVRQAEPSLALSEADARNLAAAARDRRRAQSMQQAAVVVTQPPPAPTPQSTPTAPPIAQDQPVPASGLAAAKLRARKRFADDA